jgi:hypothetical protein
MPFTETAQTEAQASALEDIRIRSYSGELYEAGRITHAEERK